MNKINVVIKKYLKEINALRESGEGREESYYPSLKALLGEIAEFHKRKDIISIAQPGNTEHGKPDFKVLTNDNREIGIIEAKKPGEDLDKLEKKDQLIRYLKGYDNLITTDFYNFRLYRNKRVIMEASLENIKQNENFDALSDLLYTFFGFSIPKKYTAEMLAKDLAKKTKKLKKEVIVEMNAENEEIIDLCKAFKEFLMKDLTTEKFADIFSQTITYGLFISRIRTKNLENFSPKTAYIDIPAGIGVLKSIFTYMLTSEDIVSENMDWIVNDITDILKQVDIAIILKEHHDPIVHFYETFLEEYDPKSRISQGVYYTPDPVVFYIASSLNFILKKRFNKTSGFANSSVTVLDPASGTMTFISKAIEIAKDENPNKGAENELIRDHILKHFYGFEVMMAPYTIGHLRMMLALEDVGYKMEKNENINLYLTNTLVEEPDRRDWKGRLVEKELLKESELSNRLKKETKVLAILGNPPYSMESKNNDPFILKLMEDYKKINGIPLKERNSKVIMDDYAKFIRFAQYKIEQNGEGVIGFITNHGFIDNVTFRGMRHSLMETFNEIYVFDLHGNADKNEVCPDGSKDENVFNIKRGVSISFFIKRKNVNGTKVYHSDLWGMQEDKYKWLLSNGFEDTKWKELEPDEPYYYFKPYNKSNLDTYNKGFRITDIFDVGSGGVKTSVNHVVIDFDKHILENKIDKFRNLAVPNEIVVEDLNLGNTRLKEEISEFRKKVSDNENIGNYYIDYSFRPFDDRNIFYSKDIVDRPRYNVMKHMLRENVALVTNRLSKKGVMPHPFVCDKIVDLDFSASASYLCPLYLYNKDKKSNIKKEVMQFINTYYEVPTTPENILHYIYGVLYSETYRSKFSEFIKADYSRIPFTTSQEIFLKMSSLGKQITNLHLMKSSELNKTVSTFDIPGSNIIEKVTHRGSDVYINETQCFNGIEDKVWEYEIGGYQVLDKWLKSHKGRKLNLEDIEHFSKIVTTISKTIEIQVEIDELYPEVEKSIIEYDEEEIKGGWFYERKRKNQTKLST
ncbi:MAG: N-6 DNA methylase [Candidatus Omnitrophica bacterium]|nr:N-6 DNA methylase [Candidatus Omnitrophota bacterium]